VGCCWTFLPLAIVVWLIWVPVQWCGHCKALAPEYVKTAQSLLQRDTDAPMRIAKIDATANPESAKAFGVAGYPTVKVGARVGCGHVSRGWVFRRRVS